MVPESEKMVIIIKNTQERMQCLEINKSINIKLARKNKNNRENLKVTIIEGHHQIQTLRNFKLKIMRLHNLLESI